MPNPYSLDLDFMMDTLKEEPKGRRPRVKAKDNINQVAPRRLASDFVIPQSQRPRIRKPKAPKEPKAPKAPKPPKQAKPRARKPKAPKEPEAKIPPPPKQVKPRARKPKVPMAVPVQTLAVAPAQSMQDVVPFSVNDEVYFKRTKKSKEIAGTIIQYTNDGKVVIRSNETNAIHIVPLSNVNQMVEYDDGSVYEIGTFVLYKMSNTEAFDPADVGIVDDYFPRIKKYRIISFGDPDTTEEERSYIVDKENVDMLPFYPFGEFNYTFDDLVNRGQMLRDVEEILSNDDLVEKYLGKDASGIEIENAMYKVLTTLYDYKKGKKTRIDLEDAINWFYQNYD